MRRFMRWLVRVLVLIVVFTASMLTAMRDRDRATALAHGETTLRRL